MSEVNKKELRRLAVEAIPDAEWFEPEHLNIHPNIDGSAAKFVAAANPATVLALVDALDRAEKIINQECQASGAYRMQALELQKERDALRAEIDGKAIVPIEPSVGLLTSMAIRSDHGLGVPGYYDQPFLLKMNHGVSHARRMECAVAEMRKLYEEVVGTGFYSADKEEGYTALNKGERQDG